MSTSTATSNNSKGSPGRMEREMVIGNKLGLHARPAAMFVRVANRFGAEIWVEKDGEEINGKSIMGLMLLAAGCGSRLKVTAVGDDAAEALKELEALIARKFDEE
jgi:phosphocarrier protein HPr